MLLYPIYFELSVEYGTFFTNIFSSSNFVYIATAKLTNVKRTDCGSSAHPQLFIFLSFHKDRYLFTLIHK